MTKGILHQVVSFRGYRRVVLLALLMISASIFPSKAQVNTYTFSTATGTVLEDVSSFTGFLISSASDDVASSVTNIGFTFNYAGTSYTQFSVSSNGLMTLGSTAVVTTSINALTVAPALKIAPYWDDLTTGTTGNVLYKLSGTAPNRKLTVDWFLRVPKNNNQAANTHIQCWLEESTNIITFVYGAVATNNGQYSIGLTASLTDYLSVVSSSNTSSTSVATNSNTSAITSGRSFKFTPPPPSCASALLPASGATSVVPNVTLSWSPGTSGGSPSSYDVYFGTTATPSLVSSSQTATSYTPTSTLSWNTVYYWQVVPKNGAGSATSCPVNSFTTASTLSYDVLRSSGVAFNSIAAIGNTIASWRNGSNTDDNLSNAVPIGFDFSYQGSNYSNVLVSTNGFLTLNTSTSSNGATSAGYAYQNTAFSAADASESVAVLAPFWDDLTCQGNNSQAAGLAASIRYLTSGVTPNRVFTIEWVAMEPPALQGADLNFQVKLYETSGVIEFHYGTMSGFFGNINPSTLPIYSYTLGINAWNVSNPLVSGEIITQQLNNSRSFSSTAKNDLATVPACNSLIQFTPGTYTAYSHVPAVPSNDNSSGALTVTVNASPCTNLCGSIYSTFSATNSGISASAGTADDDIWFKFIATSANTSIRAYGASNFDPVVEAFNATATTRIGNINATAQGFTETLNLTGLTIGSTYYVRVFHFGSSWGQSGDFALCVYETQAAPANDNCAGAIPLTINATCNVTNGSTLTATGSTGVTNCVISNANADDDVWFSFVALSAKETITVQSGHKFNAVVQVLSGTCGSLTSLSCADVTKNAQTETLNFTNLTVGSTYYVRVYQFTAGAGRGGFSICVTSPPPACVTGQYPPNASSNIPFSGTTLFWNRVADATGYDVYLDTLNPATSLIATNIVDTFVTVGLLNRGATYYYRVAPRNATGVNNSCNTLIFATEPFGYNLNIYAFLEGFYSGTRTMRPTIDPVNRDTVADTLRVKLYSTTAPYFVEYQAIALLETDGLAIAEFPQPALQRSYYIVLENRNHLETWSSTPFLFDTPDTTYDFTLTPTAAYGNNLLMLETGVYGLYSGDVNQDDVIDINDMTFMGSRLGNFSPIYRAEDLDGDRVAESADYSYLENRVFLGRIIARP